MVQSFVSRRNNNSAVCLEEENCEETTRNSVQWKFHTANHETPAECDDLGSDFNPRKAGLFFLDPGTTMNGKKYLELMKEKLELHMAVHNCEIFMHDGAMLSGKNRHGLSQDEKYQIVGMDGK